MVRFQIRISRKTFNKTFRKFYFLSCKIYLNVCLYHLPLHLYFIVIKGIDADFHSSRCVQTVPI